MRSSLNSKLTIGGYQMTDIASVLGQFVLDNRIKGIIALSGGASEQDTSNPIMKEMAKEIVKALAGKNFAISTNATAFGVPLFTIKYAKELGVPIIKIFPEKAGKYLVNDDYGLKIPISPRTGSSEWGDDSEVFVKTADGIIFIGGGTGTQIEFAHWAKINETRIKRQEKLIYGVPLCGVGGWSEIVYYKLPNFYSKIRPCFPEIPISNAKSAVKFLLENIN